MESSSFHLLYLPVVKDYTQYEKFLLLSQNKYSVIFDILLLFQVKQSLYIEEESIKMTFEWWTEMCYPVTLRNWFQFHPLELQSTYDTEITPKCSSKGHSSSS